MRYHYQRGATKIKSGNGKKKFIAVSVLLLAIGGYGAFLTALPGLGGWPFKNGDETARQVKAVAPGKDGNHLYIPKINVSVALASGAAELEGGFETGQSATVRAKSHHLDISPTVTVEKSIFSRLNQLTEGDEFFIDYNGTRYAFAVSTTDSTMTLETLDSDVKVKAKPIGIVAWNDGAPRIEVLN